MCINFLGSAIFLMKKKSISLDFHGFNYKISLLVFFKKLRIAQMKLLDLTPLPPSHQLPCLCMEPTSVYQSSYHSNTANNVTNNITIYICSYRLH